MRGLPDEAKGQPERRHWVVAEAMEENVRGNHRQVGGNQLHGALAKEHAVSPVGIEVKSPERTEDRGNSLAARRQIPRFVQRNPGAPGFDP